MGKFILVVPADGVFTGLVREAVAALLRAAPITEPERRDTQLVAAEACNALALAFLTDASVMSVTATCDERAIMITIEDSSKSREGKSVDRKLRAPLSIEARFGLRLMGELADELCFSSGLAGGIRIELTKRFEPDTAGPVDDLAVAGPAPPSPPVPDATV